MPNCDFYALGGDVLPVLDFVFQQPGWTLIELTSRMDHPLREFHATEDVLRAFPGARTAKSSLHFQLYAKIMGGRVVKKKIRFDTPRPGASFRYAAEGWGLIQLYFGQLRAGRLSPCHTNHNSARRAGTWAKSTRALGVPGNWSFAEVTRMSSRLNRFIRGTAGGKIGSRVVLPEAWKALKNKELELAVV